MHHYNLQNSLQLTLAHSGSISHILAHSDLVWLYQALIVANKVVWPQGAMCRLPIHTWSSLIYKGTATNFPQNLICFMHSPLCKFWNNISHGIISIRGIKPICLFLIKIMPSYILKENSKIAKEENWFKSTLKNLS